MPGTAPPKAAMGRRGAEQPAEKIPEEDLTLENIYTGMFNTDDDKDK